MEYETKIKGGAFQVARKVFESEIWLNKPSTWMKIWIYILGRVNHEAKNGFERGEGYFNFKQEIKAIGKDITEDTIKKCLAWHRDSGMISTRRSTRGIRLKVLNYNIYQTLDNFVGTRKALEKHQRSTPINKNIRIKELKNNTNTGEDKSSQKKTFSPLGAELIKSFESINPACKRFYGNTTQREACDNLIKEYTFERVKIVIERTLPKTNIIEYFPHIFTPLQLWEKWTALESKAKEYKLKEVNKSKVIFSS